VIEQATHNKQHEPKKPNREERKKCRPRGVNGSWRPGNQQLPGRPSMTVQDNLQASVKEVDKEAV